MPKLHLSKIGDIPIRLHRPISGEIKQITIKKYPSNKWYVSFSVECKNSIPPQANKLAKAVGIDLGTINFVYDSNGNFLEHPKFMTASLMRLQVLQRNFSKTKKGSKNRQKQRTIIAKQYEKISNQRNDFLHKLSRKYVDSYNIIAVEALEIKNLIRISYNARNISDASWSKFLQMLEYKAESAGAQLVKVEPRGTTQMCSGCSKDVPKRLWNRIHNCSYCGLIMDRDYNAAINILNLGLRKLGREPSETPLREGTNTDKKTNQQVPLMTEEATAFMPR